MMAGLSDVAGDERTARMVLSMLVEPNDPVTGRVLNGLGAMETLRLAERDGAVVGLSAIDAQVWRDHFDAPVAKDIAARLEQAQQSGIHVLVPGDADWPVALNDLGDLAPYVLWTRGASSFLARPLQDFVTITGSRASTSYGDHVARELAASTAADERVVVAGGAYGIEGAAHQAALAAGGDTIAILANGVDRPYPAGHRDLLERVADVGLLVSEVPPGTVPTRHRFIARGRLMGDCPPNGVSDLTRRLSWRGRSPDDREDHERELDAEGSQEDDLAQRGRAGRGPGAGQGRPGTW